MKKIIAFTLAEVMIVLTVIGIISAIIMPIARQSIPDKNIMLFKKGHNTIYRVVSTLANSDTYYKNGDLGMKPDGTLIKEDSDMKYFCQTFADQISTKKVDCHGTPTYNNGFVSVVELSDPLQPTLADSRCEEAENVITSAEIITSDGISFYDCNPAVMFGIDILRINQISCLDSSGNIKTDSGHSYCATANLTIPSPYRAFSASVNGVATFQNSAGFDREYKLFCMDVDGVKKGLPPFGYGIRSDGKIFNGARAKQLLEKDLTTND